MKWYNIDELTPMIGKILIASDEDWVICEGYNSIRALISTLPYLTIKYNKWCFLI